MTPTEKIEAISARLGRLGRERWRAGNHCSICRSARHTKPQCPFRGLSIWTDGVDLFIAKSAAEARAIALDPIPEDMRDEFDIPLETWIRLGDEPLTLILNDRPEKWIPRAWIVANGPGLLACDGELATGRRAP